MKQLLIALSALFSLTLSAQTVSVSYDESSQSIVFGNNRYKMIHVSGGSFTMGATPEQGSDVAKDEKPAHRVTLSDYHIGQTEVTQALWQAVMGYNPSYIQKANHPVERICWEDCQNFIRRLNSMTGKNFCLPTEAQWEFAARGGNKSHGYKYSGSNNLGNVAWFKENSNDRTHAVATKQANELGIYDMNGNVEEWCYDWYGDYSSSVQTDPIGPDNGRSRVIRGGSWDNYSGYSFGVSRRGAKSILWACSFSTRPNNFGFRLALISSSLQATAPGYNKHQQQQTTKVSYDTNSNSIVFGNNRYKMNLVSGGSFMMGASEQDASSWDSERPVHRVTLSSYYIGQTEVTQALWQAVMGDNPSRFKGDNHPVDDVAWEDCEEFIYRLNSLTGCKFRLPTEAEWEFAARGGNNSRGYKYSGSNNPEDVAWHEIKKLEEHHHPVGQKKPNELGIYDMSGNVKEWCYDWYGDYSSSAQTNPTGANPKNGSSRVVRGGGWEWVGGPGPCRVTARHNAMNLDGYPGNIGLRLVLVPSSSQNTTASNPKQSTQVQQKVHQYVDLGLSVKWATCNVGANSPEEFGNFFAWGETVGYTSNTSDGRSFNAESYKLCNDSMSKMTKYCTDSQYGTVDDKTILVPEDDAAHVNWGGSWRMPTQEEIAELCTDCTWTETSLNGKNGYKVTGPNGKSIFLPFTGYRHDDTYSNTGLLYWSSSIRDDSPTYAYGLGFESYSGEGRVEWYSYDRYDAFPVRAVHP